MYQKKARPVWFPERDPSANPEKFDGYWTFWRESTANKYIMEKAASTIPNTRTQHDCRYGNETASPVSGLQGVDSSTMAIDNANIYNVLQRILNVTTSSKKHRVPIKDRQKIRKALAELFWIMAGRVRGGIASHGRLRRMKKRQRKDKRTQKKTLRPKAAKVNHKTEHHMAALKKLKAARVSTKADISKKDVVERRENGNKREMSPVNDKWTRSRKKTAYGKSKLRHQKKEPFNFHASRGRIESRLSEETKHDNNDDDDNDYDDDNDDDYDDDNDDIDEDDGQSAGPSFRVSSSDRQRQDRILSALNKYLN